MKCADELQCATSQVHVLEVVSDYDWATSITRGMLAGSGSGTYFALLLPLLQVSDRLRDELAQVV